MDTNKIVETNTSLGTDQEAQKSDLVALLGEIAEELKAGEPIHQFLVEKWKSILNKVSPKKNERNF